MASSFSSTGSGGCSAARGGADPEQAFEAKANGTPSLQIARMFDRNQDGTRYSADGALPTGSVS